MKVFTAWERSFRAISLGTGRLWWKLAPMLLGGFTITYTASRLLQFAAARIATIQPSQEYVFSTGEGPLTWETTKNSTWNQWLGVVLLALSFLVLLIGLIVILRKIAAYLEEQHMLPQGPDSKAKSTLTQSLSITLLAFLGIYSVFDYISETTSHVLMDALMISHNSMDLIFFPLNPVTTEEYLLVGGVILGTFFLRRVVDLIGQRTGALWLGFVAAGFEAFYLLAFFICGGRLVSTAINWLSNRDVAYQLRQFVAQLSAPLQQIGINIPEILSDMWHWFWDMGWPIVLTSFLQPMLWFALVALVIGTQIESFGDLLHSGSLLSATKGRKHLEKLASKLDSSPKKRETVIQVQDAIFGDLDEKYLPVFQVLRMSWKSGVGFLGAFIIAFNLLQCLKAWTDYGLVTLIGPRSLEEQYVFAELKELLMTVLFMTLQLALLAVGYSLAFTAMSGISVLKANESTSVSIDQQTPDPALTASRAVVGLEEATQT